MKSNWFKIGAIICSPLLLISFQNCSKLGTNGIAVDDQVLSLDTTQVVNDPAIPPADSAAGSDIQDPSSSDQQLIPPVSSSDGDESKPPHDMPAPSDDDHEAPPVVGSNDDNDCSDDEDENEMEDDEQASCVEGTCKDIEIDSSDEAVAEMVLSCKKPVSENAQDLDLKFNHESVELDAKNIKRLKGNYGKPVIVRAAISDAHAKEIKVNHSIVVLCNYADIKRIRGSHNHIIVVGGKIKEIKLNHSVLSLIGATVEKAKGSHSLIKSYSLK